MPDFIYNDETKSYYIYDPDAYDEKSASKKKKKVREDVTIQMHQQPEDHASN